MNEQERIKKAVDIIRSKLGAGVSHKDFIDEITFYSDTSGEYCSIRKIHTHFGEEINRYTNGTIEIQQKITEWKSLEYFADWLEKVADKLPQVAKTPEQVKAEKIEALEKELAELKK